MAHLGSFKPELITVEEVLNYYDMEVRRNDSPLYQIFTGTTTNPEQQVTIWEDATNPNGAREHLEQFLELIAKNVNNTNVYTIRCAKEFQEAQKKGVTFQNAQGNGMRFQINQNIINKLPSLPETVGSSNTIVLPQQQNDSVMMLIEEMKRQNELLRLQNAELQEKLIAKIGSVEDEEEDEEENEEDEESKMSPKNMMFMAIAQLISNPTVQEKLTDAAIGLVNTIAGTSKSSNDEQQ